MDNELLFEENQYLGFNSYSIARRMVLAIFCFVAYYYTEDRESNADLLFLMGIIILIVSVILLFVKYIRLTIINDFLTIRGLFKTRLVKIDLSGIVKIEKTRYSRYHLNNPVFNVHTSSVIKFYTGGRDAVRMTDRDGLIYLIGTNKADELCRVVNSVINKSN